MNRHLTQFFWLIAVVCLVFIVNATSYPARVAAQATPSPLENASPDLKSKVDQLEERVDKLAKQPKDLWDKVAAISGLLSGFLAALVAIIIHSFLEKQKKREVAIQQAQTVQAFMPQLLSDKNRDVMVALLVIKELGNEKLATNLSDILDSKGAFFALQKIASGSDEAAAIARDLLEGRFTVDLEKLDPGSKELQLSVNRVLTFRDLTNQVFWALDGAIEAFTYEKKWILRNKDSGELYHKVGGTDSKKLQDVGIKGGTRLEAIPYPPESKAHDVPP